jgi:hypothetical protein
VQGYYNSGSTGMPSSSLTSLGPATTKGEGGPGETLVEKPVSKVEMKAPNADGIQITKVHSRPNNATTPAQRSSVQGKACSTCGATGGKMVADHKNPLVKEHYETGSINKKNMRSVDAVQPQCATCSARQGGKLRKYSMEQKKKNGTLAANYPTTGTPKEMYNSVGGQVAKAYNDNESKGDNNPYNNTCALRMSTALNKSGNDIDTDVKNSKGQKMYTLLKEVMAKIMLYEKVMLRII